MKSDSGSSTSVWMATAEVPPQPALTENTRADVCVVGAGIAGLTTAYLLGREGKSVVVLDDGPIAGGETCRTTAHLVNALDDRYFELQRLHGEKGARLAAQSHTAAIDRIERIVKDEKIACDFERLDGYLFVPPDEPRDILDRELEAAQHAGLNGVEMVARAPLEEFDTGPCLRFPQQALPRGAVTRALYWDTPTPYHYVRLQTIDERDDLLIVGGEDHRTGQEDDFGERYSRLEKWMKERFPRAGSAQYRWSGQIMEPADGLAFIGRNPVDDPNVFVATGDSGNGMTHGTIAGILITDLILGRPNEWVDLYDPGRKSLRALPDYVKENVKSAAAYAGWAKGGDVASTEDISAGEGAVVRRGLHKVAAYRELSGGLTELSAVCPHLGCIVEWNSAEKTWDCPCHGSRYAPDGHVINGPAKTGLAPVGDSSGD